MWSYPLLENRYRRIVFEKKKHSKGIKSKGVSFLKIYDVINRTSLVECCLLTFFPEYTKIHNPLSTLIELDSPIYNNENCMYKRYK